MLVQDPLGRVALRKIVDHLFRRLGWTRFSGRADEMCNTAARLKQDGEKAVGGALCLIGPLRSKIELHRELYIALTLRATNQSEKGAQTRGG